MEIQLGGILRIAAFLPIKICAALEHRIELWKINSIEEGRSMQWLVLIDAQAALIRVQGGRTLCCICNVFFGPMATDFADFSSLATPRSFPANFFKIPTSAHGNICNCCCYMKYPKSADD